jgi:rhamnose transport system ATP-binding protein
MVRDMVGRAVSAFAPKAAASPHGPKVLSVQDLSVAGIFEGVNFELHKGEVLCFAGLIGARRTDVGLSLFGVLPATSGTVEIEGKTVAIATPQQAMSEGIAYVSEDRRKLGLAMTMPITTNISLPNLGKLVKQLGYIDRPAERSMAEAHRQRLSIRTPSVEIDAGKLSGGNQQKVMLAKWLEMAPRILIFDEPTRGIDVGAKTEVHNIVRELAAQGVAIIIISSDLPEVLALADRVLVMREGKQVAIFGIGDATPEKIMAAATTDVADLAKAS